MTVPASPTTAEGSAQECSGTASPPDVGAQSVGVGVIALG